MEKGGEWSSAGGHVNSGEAPLRSIKREVFEELGIDIENDDVKGLGFLCYDRLLRFMYYLKKDIDIADVILQKEEAEYVKYMSVQEVNKIIEDGLITKSHGIIFREVLKYLGR